MYFNFSPGTRRSPPSGEPRSADLRTRRTYPGVIPLVHLDHVYHDPALRLERLTPHRSRLAPVASDHLPLVADFRIDT